MAQTPVLPRGDTCRLTFRPIEGSKAASRNGCFTSTPDRLLRANSGHSEGRVSWVNSTFADDRDGAVPIVGVAFWMWPVV